MNLKKRLIQFATAAKKASYHLAELSPETKKRILNEIAAHLRKSSREIMRANQKDLTLARRMGLNDAMIDRLMLNSKRVDQMADAVSQVAKLPDPIGRTLHTWRRPNGLRISKVTVPLGVILIIYESRPNVTSECASLCLKSGNAVLLRGGREAFHSNRAIVQVYAKVLKKHRIPEASVSLVPVLDRRAIDELLKMEDLINLVIPRGGEALIRRVARHSRIPVVKHYKGICHVYVDSSADLNMALRIAVNAKCQRTGVCNAMETLLVHRAIAPKFLPPYARLLKKENCEIRGDDATRRFVPTAKKATEEDWRTEYLDRILSIRVVRGMDQAIEHIQKYGSAHTDSIVTKNQKAARKFVTKVDSSSVMVNASTRFSDGNEYGFGAEIGISTDKVHARGPMGLEGLISYKYIVQGSGQVRT
ncbi:MAG: glutamate-5-semialdehyde dehydrogenase [Omnitrophica bacterium RIFCSPHIGHO2_02_FULL_46_11]|nr:MAG: glutamate-5-semialdehyde dehydrogenase [Omnitrophica bacterium RIFCSPHIGHO2_02_FULL_46_11]OGW86718.1 MAG: glutamate-5-semialdehyde dehydrogenase [Omnitrophica bacterium RIFCSPLOWO2_01_FULL_45_10b]